MAFYECTNNNNSKLKLTEWYGPVHNATIVMSKNIKGVIVTAYYPNELNKSGNVMNATFNRTTNWANGFFYNDIAISFAKSSGEETYYVCGGWSGGGSGWNGGACIINWNTHTLTDSSHTGYSGIAYCYIIEE